MSRAVSKELVVINSGVPERQASPRDRASTGAARRLAPLALLALAGGLGGCEADSWMFDQSVVGRWEHTPTTVPILERLDVIEEDSGQYVERTPVQPEDLIPEVSDYEFGPGDAVQIEIWDFVQPGQPDQRQVLIDSRGYLELPQVGRINVLGLTSDDIRELIRQVLRERGILQDALVTVQPLSQRQQTFAVFGAVQNTGRFLVPTPDYKLLEALTEAGGLSPAIPKIYIIRQAALSDSASRGIGVDRASKPLPGQAPEQTPEGRGRDINQLIEELTAPAPTPPPAESPLPPAEVPLPAREQPPIDLPGDESPKSMGAFGTNERPARVLRRQDQPEQSGGGTGQAQQPPPIDLDDATRKPEPRLPNTPVVDQAEPSSGRWMFLNGEWVRVTRKPAVSAGLPESSQTLEGRPVAPLVTQRVIEVPSAPLLQGAAEYNIIVRPGDVIHVPPPEVGNWYIGGPGIVRAGTYSLPGTGRLTLSKAIMAAGGLNSLAVPWKVDLTRMVGEDRQATIRLNLRAIVEGTNPDVFVKDQDVINIGTSFFATPMAIIRNGFRFTYGFGFLLDRNFGNDVFGAPPSNVLGQ